MPRRKLAIVQAAGAGATAPHRIKDLKEALTPKQRLFCEYLAANGSSGTDAAIAAGYVPANAKVEAWRMARRPHCVAYLSTLLSVKMGTFLASKAARRLEELMDHKNGEVALGATKEALARSGVHAVGNTPGGGVGGGQTVRLVIDLTEGGEGKTARGRGETSPASATSPRKGVIIDVEPGNGV